MNEEKQKVMVAYIIEGMAEIGPFSKAEIEGLPKVRRMPQVVWRREPVPYWWNTPDGVDRSLPMWDATRRTR